MTEGRSYTAQLSTARMILAMGETQITEHEQPGAHADRINELHKLVKTWTARVTKLEPLARREQLRAQGKGQAFGI